jgi:hypothetical protein
MQQIKKFIHRLTKEGVSVIVITENPEDFKGIEKVFVVEDWNHSWMIVDKTVGENRRMLQPDDLKDINLLKLDGLETYVQAGILEDRMFWIKLFEDFSPKKEVQEILNQLKHLVIILGGTDFYTSMESLKNKLPDSNHQDFILGPLSEKQDIDGIFYYKPKALTVIFEWPRMNDRISLFKNDQFKI